MDELSELISELVDPRAVQPTKWPHKCNRCGRFVSHDAIRNTCDSEGQYWATAYCTNCARRVNANPI